MARRRALAAEAQELGGHPWLLSFSGMANVLGWPERQPLVAVSDRPRVLTSWAAYCGGVVPLQRYIPFAAVRQLSPNDFVKVLALNLKVADWFPYKSLCYICIGRRPCRLHAICQ